MPTFAVWLASTSAFKVVYKLVCGELSALRYGAIMLFFSIKPTYQGSGVDVSNDPRTFFSLPVDFPRQRPGLGPGHGPEEREVIIVSLHHPPTHSREPPTGCNDARLQNRERHAIGQAAGTNSGPPSTSPLT